MSFLSAPQLCDAAQRCQSHTARLNVDNLLLLHHFLSAPGMFDAAQRYQTHKARLSFGNLLLLSFDTAPPGGSLFQHVKVMINPAFMPQIGRPHCLCHLCHNKCCFTQQFPAPAKEFCYLTPCRQNSDSDASDCLSLLLSCYTAACSL